MESNPIINAKSGSTGVGTGTAKYKFTAFIVFSLFDLKFRICNIRELGKVTFCLHTAVVTSLYIYVGPEDRVLSNKPA